MIKVFILSLEVNRLHQLQTSDRLIRLSISPSCQTFQKKYDEMQAQISQFSVFDELLAGEFTVVKLVTQCIILTQEC